jgi:hypothetical protein
MLETKKEDKPGSFRVVQPTLCRLHNIHRESRRELQKNKDDDVSNED